MSPDGVQSALRQSKHVRKNRTRVPQPPVVVSSAPGLEHDLFETAGRETQWTSAYLRRMVAWDLLVGLVAGVAATLGRFGSDFHPEYALVTLAMPLVWTFTLALANAYECRFLGVTIEEYRAVGRATLGFLALIATAAYATRQDLARGYTLLLIPALFAGGLAVRRGMRGWLAAHRARGELMQRTVVIGRADAVSAVMRSIRADRMQGLHPVAVCASGLDTDWDATSILEGVPVFGSPQDVVATVDLCDAEVVVVAAHPDLAGKSLRRLAWALEERGVELIVSPGLLDIAGPRMSIRPSTNLSLLHIERPANRTRVVFLKSVMDRTLALLLLACLTPLLLVLAALIKLDSRGPVFFRQARIGVRGEPFGMLKFRSMVVDAEARLAALQDGHDGNDVLFKLKDDPRVTRIGKVLRRYSLDELPQLINVLIGDMSLVGPRPPLPTEVEQYEPDALRRLHVRPGMTGLWQVSGRSDLSWEESLRLDLRYVDNWSPIGDLVILMRTFKAVVASSGAY